MSDEVIVVNFENVVEDAPVPDDIYPLKIVQFKPEGELKPKEGKYPVMKTVLEITDGPFAGRRIFTNLTTNPEPTKNGSGKNYMLFNLLKVLGLADSPSEISIDVPAVLNSEVRGKVVTKEATEDYDAKNEIRKFYTP